MANLYLPPNRRKRLQQGGFTLIELMIAIVLGLLVVAAATQLFLGGLISLRLQQGGADAQDNGMFGLDYMSRELRMTNVGNLTNMTNLFLNDRTPNGGVVLTADTSTSGTTIANLTGVRTSNSSTAYVPPGLLTRGPGGTPATTTNQWKGLTKVVTPSGLYSDQLTIQYYAPVATTDCEGNAVSVGTHLIERFFLRPDANDANSLVLACDAGTISDAIPSTTPPTPPIVTGQSQAGQAIMNHVEHFHILLGTESSAGNWVYYKVSDYLGITTTPRPQIEAIKIAVLVRSTENTASATINATQSFQMLDQTVQVATTDSNANHYLRRVYSTTVALRNGFGSAS